MKRIAINGFGRIGRLTLRNLLNKKGIKIVAINDLTDPKTLAHLFKYDSNHGIFDGVVEADKDFITIGRKKIQVFSHRDPSQLPWQKLKIDLVLECTGFFRTKEKAGLHLQAGAKNVIISAPAKSSGVPTIVMGVNEKTLKKRDDIFSNASCTTNCLAPMVKVLDENFGITRGFMTTVHAYTANQNLQDAPHSDLRRARAAAENMIPTTTGAADALGLVYPSSKGKIEASSIRVPVSTGSLIELQVIVKKKTTAAEINQAFKKAASKAFAGLIEYSTQPLVSSDIKSNTHSCIFDSELTVVNGNMVKIVGWYDNEYGYSARMADMVNLVD